MNFFVFVIAVLLSISALQAQEQTIGIGRLQVSLNHDIPLYDAKTGLSVDTIKFSVIESGKDEGKFVKTTSFFALKPMEFYVGDSKIEAYESINWGLVYFAPNLAFRVLQRSDNEFLVVLNEKTFETAIIKNNTTHKLYTLGRPYWNMTHNSSSSDEVWFLYETWETYLKRLMYVGIEGNKLYDNINGNEINSSENFWGVVVVEVKGHWAKLQDEEKRVMWVKWTDGKKFLIEPVVEIYF